MKESVETRKSFAAGYVTPEAEEMEITAEKSVLGAILSGMPEEEG